MKFPEAGSMRTMVEYQQQVRGTPTELGDQISSWLTVTTVAARVISLSGNELVRASQVHAEATVEVTVWYSDLFSPVGRFKIGNRSLYPLSVNSDQLNRFQVCLCKERIGDG